MEEKETKKMTKEEQEFQSSYETGNSPRYR